MVTAPSTRTVPAKGTRKSAFEKRGLRSDAAKAARWLELFGVVGARKGGRGTGLSSSTVIERGEMSFSKTHQGKAATLATAGLIGGRGREENTPNRKGEYLKLSKVIRTGHERWKEGRAPRSLW